MSKQPRGIDSRRRERLPESVVLELARTGMNIFGIHMERNDRGPHAEQLQEKIQALGRESEFFQGDTTDDAMRQRVVERMDLTLAKPPQGTLRVLLHSIPTLPLPPLAGAEQVASRKQIERNADLFGHSLVYWVQDCLRAGLFDWGGRILALAAPGGGPGKEVVEAHVRQLARDLAPAGITANTVLTGVMESPALRTSPGYDEFLKQARMRNPHRRLTMPEDVARCIAALCHPATYWMTGNTLHVDGGENIVG